MIFDFNWCIAQVLLQRIESRRAGKREWYKNNKSRALEYNKTRYNSSEEVRNRILSNNRKSRKKRRMEGWRRKKTWSVERSREYYRNYVRNKYSTDIMYNLKMKLRRRIHMSLRRGKSGIMKVDKTINLLGCSYENFKNYIESMFTDGMTWEKCFSGEIHLDHKTPLDAFDLAKEEEQRRAFHFSNMQPLWAHENISKGAKLMRQTELPLPV